LGEKFCSDCKAEFGLFHRRLTHHQRMLRHSFARMELEILPTCNKIMKSNSKHNGSRVAVTRISNFQQERCCVTEGLLGACILLRVCITVFHGQDLVVAGRTSVCPGGLETSYLGLRQVRQMCERKGAEHVSIELIGRSFTRIATPLHWASSKSDVGFEYVRVSAATEV
jgi:hypothetical protein